jgi:hypothetical protein
MNCSGKNRCLKQLHLYKKERKKERKTILPTALKSYSGQVPPCGKKNRENNSCNYRASGMKLGHIRKSLKFLQRKKVET